MEQTTNTPPSLRAHSKVKNNLMHNLFDGKSLQTCVYQQPSGLPCGQTDLRINFSGGRDSRISGQEQRNPMPLGDIKKEYIPGTSIIYKDLVIFCNAQT